MSLVLRILAAGILVAASACGGTATTEGSSDGGPTDGSFADAPTDGRSTDAAGDARPQGDASTGVHASDFNQSCTTNADCVLVVDGTWKETDPCCGRGCPNAAINSSDKARYDAALAQAVAQCSVGENVGCGLDCIFAEAYCNAGKCAVCTSGPGCSDAGAKDAGAD